MQLITKSNSQTKYIYWVAKAIQPLSVHLGILQRSKYIFYNFLLSFIYLFTYFFCFFVLCFPYFQWIQLLSPAQMKSIHCKLCKRVDFQCCCQTRLRQWSFAFHQHTMMSMPTSVYNYNSKNNNSKRIMYLDIFKYVRNHVRVHVHKCFSLIV